MNEKKIALESLAMDLMRVALGLQRGSIGMAERFKQEALKRSSELREAGVNDKYLNKILSCVEEVLTTTQERTAEDALMYSTLLQNLTRKNLKSL